MTLGIYNGAALINNSNTGRVEVADGASVLVQKEDGGANADIFEDRDGNTELANPFTADGNGRFAFYAPAEAQGYKITVTKGSNEHILRHQAVGLGQYSDAEAALAIPMISEPEADLVVYDGYASARPFRLTAVSLHARTAPTGQAILVEVLKDGTGTGATAQLSATSNHEKTTFGTAVSFAAGERMGFKVTQAGSTEPGNDVTITPHME